MGTIHRAGHHGRQYRRATDSAGGLLCLKADAVVDFVAVYGALLTIYFNAFERIEDYLLRRELRQAAATPWNTDGA
ncbi:MAG TPA: hypothetical protein VGD71_11505 [Kribbella sp.]|jgi:hypothetical protein